MVDRHHYLGYRRPFGRHLRYFLLDGQGRRLGCLLFTAGATHLPCRDAWIGWGERERAKRLEWVVCNSRFLLFPWVRVKCLASKALSMALRRLAEDWAVQHGYRPVLVETFIDPERFDATCYRAANWQRIGRSKGRPGEEVSGGKNRKEVYVYPLAKRCREVLRNGPPPARKRRRPPPAFAPEDAFVRLWGNVIGTVVRVANEHDRLWQQRRRVLNTLLVTLFVFRLVFSKDRQGYATTVAELWEQCRMMGIALPQATPVAASAMCRARAKLDEGLFQRLHGEILREAGAADAGKRWKGRRIFAVDGSKLNLPRQLRANGYRTPSAQAWYPQGLLSCLYQLRAKMPVDFDLHAHGNERAAALGHLPALSEGDVVVYDRGYYSYELLHAHAARGLHPVFRLKAKAGSVFDAFLAGDCADSVAEIAPGPDTLRALRTKYPGARFGPLRLRLVKYTAGGTRFALATTLLDAETTRIEDLAALYHGRWGIEELFKISKGALSVEDFHGQSERAVKQELFAHFILITLTRLFANHGEDWMNRGRQGGPKPAMAANFKNSLATVARNIEVLLLQHATALSETVTRIVEGITACRQRLRPNRSYPRRSRKPIGKWSRRKVPKARATAWPARKRSNPPPPNCDSLSEWMNPLSECHWGWTG